MGEASGGVRGALPHFLAELTASVLGQVKQWGGSHNRLNSHHSNRGGAEVYTCFQPWRGTR